MPRNTVWLWLNINVLKLGDAEATRRYLATCLRFADNLIDFIRWPTNAQNLNALMNRRVALCLAQWQIGAVTISAWFDLIPGLSCADIVTMRGPDPNARHDLQGWSRLLAQTGAITANYTINSG